MFTWSFISFKINNPLTSEQISNNSFLVNDKVTANTCCLERNIIWYWSVVRGISM